MHRYTLSSSIAVDPTNRTLNAVATFDTLDAATAAARQLRADAIADAYPLTRIVVVVGHRGRIVLDLR